MEKLLLINDHDICNLLEALVVYFQLNLAPGEVDYDDYRILIDRLHRLLEK